MYKARTLLVLGTWLAILPYLGFPFSWKEILTTITGLAIILLSYLLYREYIIIEKKERKFDNFRENYDFNDNEKRRNN